MRARRQAQSDDAEVNMTPMLDVVFILLIFFIVTAVFLDETAFEMIGPKQPEDANPPDDVMTILVDVTDRDQVFVNGSIVARSAVRAAIEKQRAELGPKSVVAVKGHRESSHDLVTYVFDQAKQAEAANVSLQKPKE